MGAPFCSIELARRIERAECGLLRAILVAVEASHPEREVFVRALAGGVAAFTTPGAPVNKLAGLGFDGVPDERALGEVEAHFAALDAPLQVEVSTLADPAVAAFFTRRGYALVGFENVLACSLLGGPVPEPPRELSIEAGGDREAWLDAVVSGFLVPEDQGVESHEEFARDVLEEVIRDLTSAEGFRRYLARRDGEVAGGASMRITDGIAQLCGSATLEAHRRRGVQTNLLARRLSDAAREGADLSVVITRPGSKSQQNAERRGFGLLYPRAVLVREPG